jgi:heme exporter protein CcmD
MNSLQHFLNMGGYAFYVWPAYGCAFVLLAVQWFIPWRRWQKCKKRGLSE